MKWLFFLVFCALLKQGSTSKTTCPRLPLNDSHLQEGSNLITNKTLGGARLQRMFKYLESEELIEQILDLDPRYSPVNVHRIFHFQVWYKCAFVCWQN